MPDATTTAPPRWIDYRRPEDLPEDPENPKAHDIPFIWASIKEQGVIEPQVLDGRTDQLISGHGRREAFMFGEQKYAAGEEPMPDGLTLDDEGRWLVPVVCGWSSRDADHARAALVGLNRGVELGGWEPTNLTAILEQLDEGLQSLAGYDSTQFAELMASTGRLGELEGGFLDGMAGSGRPSEPMNPGGHTATGGDVAELRLPMLTSERDEAMLFLRQHQRAVGAESLAATLLVVLREWKPSA